MLELSFCEFYCVCTKISGVAVQFLQDLFLRAAVDGTFGLGGLGI